MTASAIAVKALTIARAQIGKPYVWGATGPNSFDCSGLIWYAYEHAGHSWGRTSDAGQAAAGARVSQANLIVGDLVRPHVGHIQIYAGNGRIVEAPSTGHPVRECPMWGFYDGTRIVPAATPPSGSTHNPAQVKAIQSAVHVTADGTWGPATSAAATAVIRRTLTNVKFLQVCCGAYPDGAWGPKSEAARTATICRIQTAIGVTPDGAWGPISQARWVIAYANNYGK